MDQPYITDLDFKYASLPPETVRFLSEFMPATQQDADQTDGSPNAYDCESDLNEHLVGDHICLMFLQFTPTSRRLSLEHRSDLDVLLYCLCRVAFMEKCHKAVASPLNPGGLSGSF